MAPYCGRFESNASRKPADIGANHAGIHKLALAVFCIVGWPSQAVLSDKGGLGRPSHIRRANGDLCMKCRFLCVCVTVLLSTNDLRADDYPQWRGPDRTGVSKEKGLLQQWPADGPKLVWKATGIGKGYST